jgi:hypothetical protein
MKKEEIRKLLPKVSQMKRDVKAKQRQSNKLADEAYKLRQILLDLEGVVLYQGFPIKVTTYNGSVEVRSACSNSTRYAYATKVGKTKFYTLNIYKGTSKEYDGMPVEGEHTHYSSLRMMKNWVAYGKTTNEKRKRIPRRSTNV